MVSNSSQCCDESPKDSFRLSSLRPQRVFSSADDGSDVHESPKTSFRLPSISRHMVFCSSASNSQIIETPKFDARSSNQRFDVNSPVSSFALPTMSPRTFSERGGSSFSRMNRSGSALSEQDTDLTPSSASVVRRLSPLFQDDEQSRVSIDLQRSASVESYLTKKKRKYKQKRIFPERVIRKSKMKQNNKVLTEDIVKHLQSPCCSSRCSNKIPLAKIEKCRLWYNNVGKRQRTEDERSDLLSEIFETAEKDFSTKNPKFVYSIPGDRYSVIRCIFLYFTTCFS